MHALVLCLAAITPQALSHKSHASGEAPVPVEERRLRSVQVTFTLDVRSTPDTARVEIVQLVPRDREGRQTVARQHDWGIIANRVVEILETRLREKAVRRETG